MPGSVTLKALGLNSSSNQLEVPPGSLTEASNVVIRDNDIISQRRGFAIYGNQLGSPTDRASQLFSYQNRILRYFGNTIEYDTGLKNTSNVEVFSPFSGSFSKAQDGLRLKNIESNGNMYFTSSNGIQKISASSASDFTTNSGFIRKAGGIKAVDLQASVVYQFGNQTGFLPVDSTVAYRVLWLYNDKNKNLIPGTPSQRSIVVNGLLSTLLQDYNRVLGALDNINQSGSLITYGQFLQVLGLPINAASTDIYNALLLLSSTLDTTLLYADQASAAPLQISTADIDNGELVVNFTSGNPALYFIPGKSIFLDGFTYTNSSGAIDSSSTNGINGAQIVASTFSSTSTTGNLTQGTSQVTQAITVADSGGSLAGTFFNIDSANDLKKYYIWYNVSGSGIDPSISGKTGIRVNINTNAANTVVATNTAAAINSIASSDFTASVSTATITITNTVNGPAFGADPGTTGFLVTTPTAGVAGNVLTSVGSTTNVVNGSHITGTGIPTGTYVVSKTFSTITLSNNVTTTASGVSLNFDAGLLINTTLTGGTISNSSATIRENTFEAITQPIVPSNPATNSQLVGMQTYLSNIIIALQNMPVNVISSSLLTQFISGLDITNSSNVNLEITVPSNVTSDAFFQIYRSDIATATGTTILSELSPNDEDKLVYEAFPTTAQLSSRSISVLDITPDVFRGADLYTNEASGVGLAQAYDLPPFSLDINKYKNVTFFANTKTLQRLSINLIGVIKMITDYGNGLNSKTFTNSGVNTSTNTITISGHGFSNSQSIEFHNSTPSNLPGGLTASQTYYILNATTNTFQLATSSSPTSVVTLSSGGSGTHTIYNQLPKIQISNGTITNTYKFILGLNQSTRFTTVAASSLASSSTASYFYLNNSEDVNQYYVWYKLGTATDPMIVGKIGIPVIVSGGDTAPQVATKTKNTLSQFISDFNVINSTNTFTVTNTSPGLTTAPTAETSGFTVNVLVIGSGEDESTHSVLLADLVSVGQSVDETAQSLVRIINQNNSEIVNAYYISGSAGVPGEILLEDRQLSDTPFYLISNNVNTGSSFNPNISPENFIIANTVATHSIIQSSSPHGMINGDQVVITNSNSTPTIDGVYNITFIDSTHFSIPVNVSVAGNQGSFEKTVDALFSDNEQKGNRIYYSVFKQPDSVPLVNFLDVGSQDQSIIRIMPLRDSLFVFKQDGLWRVSGETAPFTVALFDSSCIVVAPDSVAVSNNMIFAWTTRGIVVVTEGGVNNISNNTINDIVKPLSSITFPSFSSATWGIGYESDNSYIVSTVLKPTDTIAKVSYRYDQITNTWTSYDKSYTCGVVNEFDDRLYVGAGDLNVIEQERKTFTRLDYADRELPLVLSANNYFGNLMNFLVSISNIENGDVLLQSQLLTIYQFNQLLHKLDFDPNIANDYFSTIQAKPGDNIRTDVINLSQKLDSDPGTSFKSYFSGIDTQSGSISNISISNPTIITTSSPHMLQDNRIITITGGNSNPTVNDTYPVTIIDSTHFSIPVNVTLTSGNTGTFVTIDNDFRDIQACYNYIIQQLNLDTGVGFKNYKESVGTTEQEAIIVNVNSIKKQLTTNLVLPLVQGPISVFKAIKTTVTYSPITFNDPLGLKQISEATLMFANKAFTSAILSFASDIIPVFTPIPFNGDGNGLFGYSGNLMGFGSNFFGGQSHGSPFRTLIPLVNQRCRYLISQFEHGIARETWQIYGLTLNGAVGQSTRTTR